MDPRRRARLIVFSTCFAADVLMVLEWFQRRWLAAHDVAAFLLFAAGFAVAAVVVVLALQPLRSAAPPAAEPRDVDWRSPRVWRELVLAAATLLLAWPLLVHFVAGDPWRLAWSRPLAVLAYYAVWIPLARTQRRGVAPRFRPAWYGFLLAGATGGLAWAAFMGSGLDRAVIGGLVWASMHLAALRLDDRYRGIPAG